MPFYYFYEDTGYVAVRLDFVQFASLDERREHWTVLGASVVACEKVFLRCSVIGRIVRF